MTFLLSFLLLTVSPSPYEYDSNYCEEVATEAAQAVKGGVITYKEATAIVDRCLETFAPYQAL